MKNAIILYDDFPNNFEDLSYKEKIKQITKFYINPPNNFDIIKSSNLNNTLELISEKYEWVFINLLGHAVHINNLYEEIIAYCKQNNYPICGHIVFYKNNYPALDKQFICINMKIYNELNKPKFNFTNSSHKFESFNIIRSVENFHDDYTPYWVKADFKNLKNYNAFHDFSLFFTKCYLEAGFTVGNLNESMRLKKFNLYAVPNYEKNKRFFETKTYDEPPPDIFKNILNEYENLKNTIYVLNSENMNCQKKFDNSVDTYIGVAGGFKHIMLLNFLNFTENTNVIFVDISLVALDYQKYLIDNWDGNLNNYFTVFKNYESKFPNYKYAWRSWNSWENEIELFLKQGNITRETFYLNWQKYIKLKHNFIHMDLIKDYNILFDMLKQYNNQNIYMWLSNVYKMQWNLFFENFDMIDQKFENFLSQLKTTSNHYIIESHNFHTINC